MEQTAQIATIDTNTPSQWLLENAEITKTKDWKTVFFNKIDNHGACIAATDAKDEVDFQHVISELGVQVAPQYSDLPNIKNQNNIFGTTPYPSSDAILFHNEASHMNAFPQYIFFYCQKAAEEGGSTPLSDGKYAFSLLPEDIQIALKNKGLRYFRRFIPNLDVSWQSFFGCTSIEEVEKICHANQMNYAHYSNDILETSYTTGGLYSLDDATPAMFHQIALFHPAFLDEDVKDYFESSIGLLPRMVTFSDGSEIPDEWARAIHSAQIEASQAFKWQSGYIVGVDNMRMAHARAPFKGERTHYVMLSKLIEKNKHV